MEGETAARKRLAVTRQEAELILDSFSVSNPAKRDLVLRVASIVLAFEAEEAVREAERLTVARKS
jgi:hypothetical protein